jgi:hypothetical protein
MFRGKNKTFSMLPTQLFYPISYIMNTVRGTLTEMNYPAASSGVSHVMPDLIRHPGRFLLDSGFRRNDRTAASRGE